MIREVGGWAEDVSDIEVVAGIQELAETEGIFTETAGGVTTAVTARLIAQGRIGADETTVFCITGNGLKTLDCLQGRFDIGRPCGPGLLTSKSTWQNLTALHPLPHLLNWSQSCFSRLEEPTFTNKGTVGL